MDNILKILLSVLGVAGLLAMLTPSSTSVAPPDPEQIVQVASPADEVAEIAPDEAIVEEADEEIVRFGEPMIDGNPVGDDETPQQQNVDNPNQLASVDNGPQAVNYQQVLDNAAQGRYGVQALQPAPPISDPIEQSETID